MRTTRQRRQTNESEDRHQAVLSCADSRNGRAVDACPRLLLLAKTTCGGREGFIVRDEAIRHLEHESQGIERNEEIDVVAMRRALVGTRPHGECRVQILEGANVQKYTVDLRRCLEVFLLVAVMTGCGGGASTPPPTNPTPVGPNSSQCPTDHVRGVYTAGKATSTATGIDGSLLLNFWSVVESSEGTYDFSSIDAALLQVPSGQHVHLSILTAGGVGSNGPNGPTYGTPSWLLNKLTPSGISALPMMPIPTNQTYLDALHKLVIAEGARYDSNTQVCFVDATGPTGRLSWQQLNGQTWPNYNRADVINAWDNYIDWLLAAFPHKMFTLPLQIYNDGLPNGEAVAEAVMDHIVSVGAVSRFAAFYEAWSSTTPDTSGFVGTLITYAKAKGFSVGFQEVSPLGTDFRPALNFAFDTWGAAYLEVYVGDINAQDIAFAHSTIWH